MINRKELEETAGIKRLSLGYAEKDYLQDLILFSISKNTKDEMVLKGGTCLYKFYKLDRFSEDLDFSLANEIDTDKLFKGVIRDLKAFGIEAKILEKKKVFNSVLASFRIFGPLYSGGDQSACRIRIDINLKSEVVLKPELMRLISAYRDVPTCFVQVMKEKEILAEKVRAILTRNYARDVYDLYFLLEKGIEIDLELVNQKMRYYNEIWNPEKFSQRLQEKKPLWEKELKPLLRELPEFEEVVKTIKKEVNSIK